MSEKKKHFDILFNFPRRKIKTNKIRTRFPFSAGVGVVALSSNKVFIHGFSNNTCMLAPLNLYNKVQGFVIIKHIEVTKITWWILILEPKEDCLERRNGILEKFQASCQEVEMVGFLVDVSVANSSSFHCLHSHLLE